MRKKRTTIFALTALLFAGCISAASPKAMPVSAATTANTATTESSEKAVNYTKKMVETSKKFTLKVKNAEKTDKITYKSANKKIATVSSKGVVTGVSAGKTTITVTLTDKNKKKQTFQCAVTVKKLYVPKITDVKLTKKGDVDLDSKPSVKLSYRIDKAASAKIEVYNQNGEVVYKKTASVKKNKLNTFTWNCKGTNGKLVAEGSYYFKVTADTAEAVSESFYASKKKASGNYKHAFEGRYWVMYDGGYGCYYDGKKEISVSEYGKFESDYSVDEDGVIQINGIDEWGEAYEYWLYCSVDESGDTPVLWMSDGGEAEIMYVETDKATFDAIWK